jgi:hypothetical protein
MVGLDPTDRCRTNALTISVFVIQVSAIPYFRGRPGTIEEVARDWLRDSSRDDCNSYPSGRRVIWLYRENLYAEQVELVNAARLTAEERSAKLHNLAEERHQGMGRLKHQQAGKNKRDRWQAQGFVMFEKKRVTLNPRRAKARPAVVVRPAGESDEDEISPTDVAYDEVPTGSTQDRLDDVRESATPPKKKYRYVSKPLPQLSATAKGRASVLALPRPGNAAKGRATILARYSNIPCLGVEPTVGRIVRSRTAEEQRTLPPPPGADYGEDQLGDGWNPHRWKDNREGWRTWAKVHDPEPRWWKEFLLEADEESLLHQKRAKGQSRKLWIEIRAVHRAIEAGVSWLLPVLPQCMEEKRWVDPPPEPRYDTKGELIHFPHSDFRKTEGRRLETLVAALTFMKRFSCAPVEETAAGRVSSAGRLLQQVVRTRGLAIDESRFHAPPAELPTYGVEIIMGRTKALASAETSVAETVAVAAIPEAAPGMEVDDTSVTTGLFGEPSDLRHWLNTRPGTATVDTCIRERFASYTSNTPVTREVAVVPPLTAQEAAVATMTKPTDEIEPESAEQTQVAIPMAVDPLAGGDDGTGLMDELLQEPDKGLEDLTAEEEEILAAVFGQEEEDIPS